MSPSVHVYVINSPFAYTGKSLTVAVHEFAAFNTTFPTFFVPFDKVTVKLVGLFPS